MSDQKSKHTASIKQTAKEFGFSFCGISAAVFLETEASRLENWLSSNKHGSMGYMEQHFDKRLDPRLLVDGAKSVISLMYNYYTERDQKKEESDPKFSIYAYGEDYHLVIKDILAKMVLQMQKEIGAFSFRIFVDSAPVLEKAWAAKSGLGWIGKNSNLISKEQGSFFFLAEIILDVELLYDAPIKDYCGTCTACIDACPTDAIHDPYIVDGNKCISYFTIELKDAIIPNSEKGKFNNWVFGCDICQDVCPWNRFSKKHEEKRFDPSTEFLSMKKEDWYALTNEKFNQLFGKSAVKRTKFQGLQRNLNFIKQ